MASITLAVIVGVYFVFGGLYIILTPVFEKPDEQWHFAYVAYLLEHGQLPPLLANESLNPALQEAGQPPLFYGLAALSARLFGLEAPQTNPASNPYWGYPALGTTNDNKNRFVHVDVELHQPMWRIVYVLRSLSLVLGAGALICAYGLTRALNGSQALGLCSAAVLALQPQYLYTAGSVSNDASVSFLCGAALWTLIVIVNASGKTNRWLLLGLLIGLATLAKTSALWLAVFSTGVALWLGIRQRSIRTAGIGIASCWGGVLACSGWWYARNWIVYGDPLGFGIHITMMGDTASLPLVVVFEKWMALGHSFWAEFGWGFVRLPVWLYWGMRLMELSAVMGLGLIFFDRSSSRTRQGSYVLLLLYIGGVFASLVSWMNLTGWVLGRLLFPALTPIAVLLVIGWARVWARLPGLFVTYLVMVNLLASVIIARAFLPPVLLPHAVAPIGTRPTLVYFGHLARLFALNVAPQRVIPGNDTTVTLCWEALSTTSRNYSIFVQLLGPANTFAGQRNTYPGLGAYATTRWRTGDAFCDELIVPINAQAVGPLVYGVSIGVFDLDTMERLPAYDAAGNSQALVIVDHVKVYGSERVFPASTTRVEANFAGQIALRGYEVNTGLPGQDLLVTLYWQALSEIPADYTVFVHMLNASGQIVAQNDAMPHSGWFPTSWWETSEVVADQHQIVLPSELLTGEYSLQAGMYLLETGERLRLTDTDQDVVDLGLVHIVRPTSTIEGIQTPR